MRRLSTRISDLVDESFFLRHYIKAGTWAAGWLGPTWSLSCLASRSLHLAPEFLAPPLALMSSSGPALSFQAGQTLLWLPEFWSTLTLDSKLALDFRAACRSGQEDLLLCQPSDPTESSMARMIPCFSVQMDIPGDLPKGNLGRSLLMC